MRRAEARHLGIYQPLLDRCAVGVPWWVVPDGTRDLVTTTPSQLGCLNFYHPEMQQTLLDMAVASGAELLRPGEAVGSLPAPAHHSRPGERLRAADHRPTRGWSGWAELAVARPGRFLAQS